MLTDTLLSNNVEFFKLLIVNVIFLRDYLRVHRLRRLYNLAVSPASVGNGVVRDSGLRRSGYVGRPPSLCFQAFSKGEIEKGTSGNVGSALYIRGHISI